MGRGETGTLFKEQGSHNLIQSMEHKGPVLRPRCIGPEGLESSYFSIPPDDGLHMCPKHVEVD